ncbi:hypothetical protein [Paenibacillus sp. BIC5C1]|uniref:hypothetical protein n=1 Tax=Paenibacillus TaxID=44249 RepID=UPI0028E8C567|nr:hypothetical protein [Paenibacillus sp. BIC5C1]
MRKIRITSMLKVMIVAALSAPIILSIPTAGVAVASPSIKPHALTPPPPPLEPSIHALTSPKYIYQAVGTVTPGGGLTAIVNTTTTTFSEMKSLQVDYRLERWTGSAWILYQSGSKKKTQTQTLNAQSSWTVITGYYYRVVSLHTADDGVKPESSTHISSNVLF